LRPGPSARAALVLAAFLVLFVLVDRLSGPGGSGQGTVSSSAPGATDSSAPRAASSSTRPPATSAPTTTRPTATESTARPAAGVTVQVLNGAFVTGLAHRVADRVRAAGYEVVAANTALGTPVSRVYYTDGHRADAEAFRKRFPAFQVAPAPANLSRQVDLHVVIGKNYPGV
jgi:LytR cell envelope-related transcriptional attenuator